MSQPPPNSSTPTDNTNVGANEFPKFSTQMALGGMNGANKVNPNAEDSTPTHRKNVKWSTEQNLVLLSGGLNMEQTTLLEETKKNEAYWDKIADYCIEHCSFHPPHDGTSCKNHYNYVNKRLSKWIGAYDNAKGMQQNGWSENDVLAKTHELYSSDKNVNFNLMSEWHAVRDQPRYGSQVEENTGSGSSGSKRSRESDGSGSSSVGSIARPMGRDAAKKKSKKKSKGASMEVINKECNEFKQLKEKELERLDKIAMRQEEVNQLMKERTQTKKMNLFMKLSEKEYLDDRNKELLEKLSHDLFGN